MCGFSFNFVDFRDLFRFIDSEIHLFLIIFAWKCIMFYILIIILFLDVRIVAQQTIVIGNVKNKRISQVKSLVTNVEGMVTLLLIVKSKRKCTNFSLRNILYILNV